MATLGELINWGGHRVSRGDCYAARSHPVLGHEIITVRVRIADALGHNERTISRWICSGLLRAATNGPTKNNLMQARGADLEKPKTYSDSAASES
jgi:hypothetical protein